MTDGKSYPDGTERFLRGFFVEPYKDKGEAMEEQKDKKQDQPVIISYRRRCESDTAGTGLSHYIMIEDEE